VRKLKEVKDTHMDDFLEGRVYTPMIYAIMTELENYDNTSAKNRSEIALINKVKKIVKYKNYE